MVTWTMCYSEIDALAQEDSMISAIGRQEGLVNFEKLKIKRKWKLFKTRPIFILFKPTY